MVLRPLSQTEMPLFRASAVADKIIACRRIDNQPIGFKNNINNKKYRQSLGRTDSGEKQ
jgi:hypothetical protein